MDVMTLGAIGADWNPSLTEEQKRSAKLVYGIAGTMLVVGVLGMIFFAARSDERGMRGLGATKKKSKKPKLYAEHVRLDRGGYDSRGRYWGVGQKLYRVSSDDGAIDAYVRADNAQVAKRKANPVR